MKVKLFDSLDEAKSILNENEPRLVKAKGKNICIVRQGSHLIAFNNECPHMGDNLYQGNINAFNQIVCPLHSYRFDLKTGEADGKDCQPLRFIEIIIEDDIYLKID